MQIRYIDYLCISGILECKTYDRKPKLNMYLKSNVYEANDLCTKNQMYDANEQSILKSKSRNRKLQLNATGQIHGGGDYS